MTGLVGSEDDREFFAKLNKQELAMQTLVNRVNNITNPLATTSVIAASAGDHGDQSGLSDDDHTQYTLANGTRAFTGNVDMGGNDISNIGNIDGRDVSVDGAKLDTFDAGLADFSQAEIDWLESLHATGVSDTEFDYLDGVTSNIQTQLDGKAASSHTHTVSDISDLDNELANLSKAEIDFLEAIYATEVTDTEFDYLDGVTSNIQSQLDAMVEKAGDTMTGQLINTGTTPNATEDTARDSIANYPFVVEEGYTNGEYVPLLGAYAADNNATKTKVGIYYRQSGAGTQLIFGVSNSFSAGITSRVLIDSDGDLNIGGNDLDSIGGLNMNDNAGIFWEGNEIIDYDHTNNYLVIKRRIDPDSTNLRDMGDATLYWDDINADNFFNRSALEDKRNIVYMDDIKNDDRGLTLIEQLKPAVYRREKVDKTSIQYPKDEAGNPLPMTYNTYDAWDYGLIAPDLVGLNHFYLDRLLARDEQGTPNGIAYIRLVPILVQAVKELSAKLNQLLSNP